jgi:AcrR family transcriptional regulator
VPAPASAAPASAPPETVTAERAPAETSPAETAPAEPSPPATAPLEPSPARASDLPQRAAGTRSRSGNAMHRTRAALLDATEHCLERYGARRTTMGDVALKAAVAKATLYNHFRTKDDLLGALAAARVEELGLACREVAAGRPLPRPLPGTDGVDAGTGLAAALQVAAATLAAWPVLRRLVTEEPALAARLAAPGPRGSAAAHDAVRAVLAAAGADDGAPAVDLVLRWLVSQVLWPAPAAETLVTTELLTAALVRSDA